MPNKRKQTKPIVQYKVRNLSPEALMNQAIQKGVTVDIMERLLAMRRELKTEKAKELYDTAMSQFQAECPTIRKKKIVLNKDKTKRYGYAPLDFIVEQVKDLIQRHGFSYSIDAKVDDKWVEAICTITHQFGHSQKSSFKIPIDSEAYMTQPQRFASALTFAKRYAFCNAFGILTSDVDDDGAKAGEIAKVPTVSRETELKAKLKMIQAQTDPMVLQEWQSKIEKSKDYSQEEKQVFLKAIVEKIKEIIK